MRGQDDLTLSVSSLCLRLVAGQKMKSNHRHVLREGLGIALIFGDVDALPTLLQYTNEGGLFGVSSGDGSSSIF